MNILLVLMLYLEKKTTKKQRAFWTFILRAHLKTRTELKIHAITANFPQKPCALYAASHEINLL